MTREQFKLERAKGIGGSDMAPILGISPWRSIRDVFLDKTGKGEDKDSPQLRRGRSLEPIILDRYSLISGEKLITNLPCIKDRAYPFLIGNIDARCAGENVIIEAKSTSKAPSAWEGIPDYYLCQVAHYAALADADRVDVIVLFNSWKSSFSASDYKVFSYYRDYEYEEKIRRAAIDFWQNHVLTGIPPLVEEAEKNGAATEVAIEANEGVKALVEEYEQVATQIKLLGVKEEELKASITRHMGEANVLSSEKHKVTWKNVLSSRVDTNKLKLDHPSVYLDCLKEINAKTFKLTRREYE